MNSDKSLAKWLILLLLLPIGMAAFSGDRFRYPCQDPDNWNKEECQKPQCEVKRTCPEHLFKGKDSKTTTDLSRNPTIRKECN